MGTLANRVLLAVVILFVVVAGHFVITTFMQHTSPDAQTASEYLKLHDDHRRLIATEKGRKKMNILNDGGQNSVVSNKGTQKLKTAQEVRETRNESAGIFLGTGFIPEFFQNMSLTEAQMLFHGHIIDIRYSCKNIKRFGHITDGGYDVCIDDSFVPKKKNCLVYSFGIRNEWSFDDAINDYYGCDVHSFDPSMGEKAHMHKEPNMYYYNLGIWGSNMKNSDKWELRDLKTIMKMLGHENRVIDYLKVDVEGAEWPLITHLIQSGVHKQVKQMALELHTPRLLSKHQPMSVTDYAEIYHGLNKLKDLGFKKFQYHANNGCCRKFVELTPASISRKKKLCCYETFYVNANFIK